NVFAINIMSAPGAGKTTLLEATVESLVLKYKLSVIEGDMVGELDAERLRKFGTDVHQICTGRSCHLDATMIGRLLHSMELNSDFLFIENVGNLVCPAEFQLGEHKRVVLLSVTEGDDKPIKYPIIFRNCDAVIFSKCDLLPYVNFDTKAAEKNIRALNPDLEIFQLSSMKHTGFENWIGWLEAELVRHKQREQTNVCVGAG
ncbi:MAG: hydrogenase nickel incorporation protein HypB, partial [Cyanobacteria bacterium]|nr:hydrogenase nickel incorporation protein HypB [Cyanobacteriota bacterium]